MTLAQRTGVCKGRVGMECQGTDQVQQALFFCGVAVEHMLTAETNFSALASFLTFLGINIETFFFFSA